MQRTHRERQKLSVQGSPTTYFCPRAPQWVTLGYGRFTFIALMVLYSTYTMQGVHKHNLMQESYFKKSVFVKFIMFCLSFCCFQSFHFIVRCSCYFVHALSSYLGQSTSQQPRSSSRGWYQHLFLSWGLLGQTAEMPALPTETEGKRRGGGGGLNNPTVSDMQS